MVAYAELGVRPVINADARWTGLGGSVLRAGVADAMAAASRNFVDINDLQRKAGRRIAELTRNEGGYITVGGAAAIAVSVLACLTRGDAHAIARLPSVEGLRCEVIIHTAHRFPFDPAVALVNAHLKQVGNAYRTGPEELEAALSDRTGAVLYVAGDHLHGALPLAKTLEIAHAQGVPVVVDAAAQLPPKSNLWHFSAELGADLVIFSGGKELGGPQASGLIVGKAELIEACRAVGPPSPTLIRALKTGKEEMVGLLTAVEGYMAEDEEKHLAEVEATVAQWISELSTHPGVSTTRVFPNIDGQPTARARVTFDESVTRVRGDRVRDQLRAGDPSIAVGADGRDSVLLNADTLQPGEAAIVLGRIAELLANARQ